MLSGTSVSHVRQGLGKAFSKDQVAGYYNDFTAKVDMQPELLETTELPMLETASGHKVYFPVEVFQYGFGAYDLFLLTADRRYHVKFMQTVTWTMQNQQEDGSWNNFFFIYPSHPYGAMAQGEGASLLLRAYSETKDEKYLISARKALDFMLKPIQEGGTTEYSDQGLVLMEYTHRPTVLNGWIFAWWGLYDYMQTTGEHGKYYEAMEASCKALITSLPAFSTWYWSNYDLGGRIASPHYQIIHIAQLQAMYQLTGLSPFAEYANLWADYQKKPLNKSIAFIKKAYQKIIERE